MTKNKDKDMDQTRAILEKTINQRYKKSFRQHLDDFFTTTLSLIFLIFCAIVVLVIIIGIFALTFTIIENQTSLLILILGIILIIVIGRRI